MKSLEAYKKFQLKFDSLNTEDNIDISPGEFCLIFNEQQNLFVREKIKNNSTRYIDEIECLMVVDKSIKDLKKSKNYFSVTLPDDYLDYVTSSSIANSNNCKNKKIFNYEVKMVDLNTYLSDEFNKPSFEFEETIVTIGQKGIQIYYEDFDITEVLLTYYRNPVKIDIEGYINLEGEESINQDPELPDDIIDKIIDLCVIQASSSYNDTIKAQLTQLKINQNKNI